MRSPRSRPCWPKRPNVEAATPGRGVVHRTALYDTHAELGATFTEFAGFEMPVHYGSIKEEHAAVRENAGLFDVSHMSNLWISGEDAAHTISAVCPFDASSLPDGKGKYTVIVRDDGTILDDTFVFRVGDKFHLVPNAGMNEAAAQHLRRHAPDDAQVDIDDHTHGTAILALQGPSARSILARVMEDPLPKFHRIVHAHIAGVHVGVSGTGYTGEKGVEVFAPAEGAHDIWQTLMEAGRDDGIRPIGLGARDTLRLEKGYCLAGNEFAGGRTPLEANLAWVIDWDHDFLGKDALTAQKETGHSVLRGLTLDKGIPRPGYRVLRDGAVIGMVTSGTQSPTLGHGIGLAYLDGTSEGDQVSLEVRSRKVPATVTAPPFV